jgi:hypothetical protein
LIPAAPRVSQPTIIIIPPRGVIIRIDVIFSQTDKYILKLKSVVPIIKKIALHFN